MPWYSPTIRQMTPAELKRDKERLDAFMEPFEREYALKHPSPDELARQQAEAEAKKVMDGWDRSGRGGIQEPNPEWGI